VTAVVAVANLPRLDPDLDAPEPGIIGRLRLLPSLPSFSSALDRWKTPSDPHTALTELISAAARVVAVRDDAPIAYCHTVTGPAAVRMTLSQLPESLWWPSVAATWQVIGGIISAFAAPVRTASHRQRRFPSLRQTTLSTTWQSLPLRTAMNTSSS
jgi:hypothetical protein